jgi:ABC-type nitrate/sulfonate/bicarbonate transport system substrate-binding protein
MRPASNWIRFALLLPLLTGTMVGAPQISRAEPVKIRFGTSTATEETMWLLLARPDLTPGQGKDYTIDYTRFAGADKRFQAFQAGALDIAAVSANAGLFAAAEGIDLKMIASISRESKRGFYTLFMVREDSPIKTMQDLKGKTISINGFSGSGHLWTRVALEKNGLKQSDVTIVPLPFAALAQHDGGVRTLYTSKDAAPEEEELVILIGHDEFLRQNRPAIEAMLSDLVIVIKYYAEHPKESREALIKAKLVNVDPAVYLTMSDYYRDPGARLDTEALARMQELQIAAGFQKKRADLSKYVDLSYLPK